MKKLIIIIGFLAGTILNSACLSGVDDSENSTTLKWSAIILPHHLLVEKDIDDFYSEKADEKVDLILLMSPNHFNYGYRYIQTSDLFIPDMEAISFLAKKKIVYVENSKFKKEHGITAHTDKIQKAFPNAKIFPILFKEGTPRLKLDEFISEILIYFRESPKKILILASIDFNHFQHEKIAYESDMNLISFLENFKQEKDLYSKIKSLYKFDENSDGINFDSPETFYVLLRLVSELNLGDFKFYKRTSSADLTKIMDPAQNTSHIFGSF